MRSRHSIRFFAFFLSLLLLVSALPLYAFSANISNVFGNKSNETQTVDSQNVTSFDYKDESNQSFPCEIAELRTENVKHFDNGDGTYVAISYGNAVHRKDVKGEWQDIDNTLTLREDRGVKRYNDANERISFSPSASSENTLWELSENGYFISLALSDANLRSGVQADVKNHASRAEQIAMAKQSDDTEAFFRIDNSTKILYQNVLPDVDLEYTLSGNDVKESILVQKVRDQYDFSFHLFLSGLIPKATDDGEIQLLDAKDGEIIYVLPAPYMLDADYEYSNAVAYCLTDLGEGEYRIVVSASSKWINDPERVFPVVIDPTLTSPTGCTADTCVNPNYPDNCYGSSTVMRIGTTRVSFIKSSAMPKLPDGATVYDGRVHFAYYLNTPAPGSMVITQHIATRDWSEGSTTWNEISQNGTDMSLGLSPAFSSATLTNISGTTQWAEAGITEAAQYWYNGTRFANNFNYGIGLKWNAGPYLNVLLHTRNAANGYTPYFSIKYRPINGIYGLVNPSAGCFLRGTSPHLSGGTGYHSLTNPRDSFIKIAYRAGTDDFVIRSMADNALIIYHNTTLHMPLAESVTVNGSPATDSNVSTAHTWKIGVHPDYSDDNHLAIWNVCGGQNYYLAAEETSYGYSIFLTTNPSDPGADWFFVDENDYDEKGVIPIPPVPEHMNIGQTIDFNFTMYDSRIGINGPVYYSVKDTDGTMTNRATIDSETGLLTAQRYGKIQLRVSYPGASTVWIWEISIGGTFVGEVPTTLRSNSNHLCIPCAITNVASFWCVSENLTQFGCETSQQLETRAAEVHVAMALAGSAQANAHIQAGYNIFSHTENGQTYTLNSLNCWASQNAFDWNSIVSEINAGRPVMLGFAGVQGSPYQGHMTVCVGYTVIGGTRYVFLSDAHQGGYVCQPFSEAYNDFIAKVNLVSD